MASDTSGYFVLNDLEERLIIFDIYIIGTIGLTLAIIMLYSLICMRRESKTKSLNKYYRYAITCGIISCISYIILYVIRILSTDLIFPVNFADNINGATIIDSFIFIFWGLEKLFFFYGFSLLYCSLYSKKEIGNLLGSMMAIYGITLIFYEIYLFVSDIMTTELNEISHGENRGIYVIITTNNNEPPVPVLIVAAIAIITDSCMEILLIYRFYVNGIKNGDNNGTKGVVLLLISFISWTFIFSINMTSSDIKFFYFNIPIIIDLICLYLMYDDNQQIYDILCGCIGSKYKQIKPIDDNENEEDVEEESNQQLV